MPSISGAHANLKVARKHLFDLKTDISELGQPQTETIEVKRHPRRPQMLRAKLPKRTEYIAAQVGAFAVALQSTLNQLAHALWELDTGKPVPPKQARFPICQSPKDFKSRVMTDLRGLSVEHWALVESLQPYKRCDTLAMLPKLANQNKHENIVDITTTGDITWEYTHHLRFPRDPRADTKGDAAFESFLPINSAVYAKNTVQVQSHMTGTVVFRKSNTPVVNVLDILYAEVAHILKTFEPLLE